MTDVLEPDGYCLREPDGTFDASTMQRTEKLVWFCAIRKRWFENTLSRENPHEHLRAAGYSVAPVRIVEIGDDGYCLKGPDGKLFKKVIYKSDQMAWFPAIWFCNKRTGSPELLFNHEPFHLQLQAAGYSVVSVRVVEVGE